MRLIDADALKEKQVNVCYEDDYESDGFGVVYVRHIDEAPTIAAVPVKRGRWEDLREAYNDVPRSKCSLCGREIIGLESHYNFCPNCGADMRERKET